MGVDASEYHFSSEHWTVTGTRRLTPARSRIAKACGLRHLVDEQGEDQHHRPHTLIISPHERAPAQACVVPRDRQHLENQQSDLTLQNIRHPLEQYQLRFSIPSPHRTSTPRRSTVIHTITATRQRGQTEGPMARITKPSGAKRNGQEPTRRSLAHLGVPDGRDVLAVYFWWVRQRYYRAQTQHVPDSSEYASSTRSVLGEEDREPLSPRPGMELGQGWMKEKGWESVLCGVGGQFD
ncbi:hypothetical protein BDV96DRAFT_635342 [Lophiotrema nucula]|uniref:Uncharacterized protein n=1 Tax=Lophiotrema nucula TaxID=690887 RepID=A0A6A5YUR5_9PLEO|nr:hypothetical protein BDV96DRAFT_635342 [Lophiotrema nucula]